MPTSTSDILVRAIMSSTSGLPEDEFVNDFAFRWIGSGVAPTDAQLVQLMGAVDSFYNDTQASTFSVSDFIGEAVNRAVTHRMEFVTISTGGSPRLVEPWLGPAAPTVANTNLPTEVAAVLSYHADLTGALEEVGATRPRARRRGRIYVGPLTASGINLGDDAPMLSTDLLSTMRQAAIDMADEADTLGFVWCVWSRADNELRGVSGGWTDNAPDTQRRRGQDSTARVTFSV